MDEAVVGAHSVQVGQGEPEGLSIARNIALRQLSHSPRTRAQVERTLVKKNVPAEVVEKVLDWLVEIRLIDDLQYAHMFVRSRCTSKKISRVSLMRELRAKGVPDEFARAAVDEISDEDEYQLARQVAQKKLRSMRGLDREVVVRRLIGMLARKGYSGLVTSKVLKDLELDVDNLTQGDYYLAE